MTAIIAFIFVIAILVFVHELGHFLVAKWSGVRVEKFSLGFGKKLLGITRGETEYIICMLPLGGYVKMYGEGGEGGVIVDSVEPGSNAEKVGFRSGDRIVNIEDVEIEHIDKWSNVKAILDKEPESKCKFTIDRDGKRFTLSTLPLNLNGAQNYSEIEYPRSFSNQSIIKRFLIVLAGPFMNFLLPFVFLPIVFMLGIAVPAYLEQSPVIGYITPKSSADKAGFLKGDKVLEIDGREVSTWKEVNLELQTNIDAIVSVLIEREGETQRLELKAAASPEGIVVAGFGEATEARVGGVITDTPADKAGIKRGDRIVAIDGEPISDWSHMSSVIRRNASNQLIMGIEREHITDPQSSGGQASGRGIETFDVQITPEPRGEGGKGAIGIQVYKEETLKKYGFFESIVNGVKGALGMIIEVTTLLFGFLYKLITGKIALGAAGKSLAGPILIAKVSGSAAESGIAMLLQFTCFISINLAIINLFPIPMLDGGHVVYLTIEAIRRKPLSARILNTSQRIGFAILICIMALAIYNDVSRVKGDILSSLNRVIEVFR